MSRSPHDLQGCELGQDPQEVRGIPVRLLDQPQFLPLNNTNGYSDRVEAKGQFVSQGRSYGNENRRWHGTVRECTIGDEGETELCSDPSCSLCCIMKTTFDLAVSAKKTNFRRFGMGIYTSSTSSKFVSHLPSVPELRSNRSDWVLQDRSVFA